MTSYTSRLIALILLVLTIPVIFLLGIAISIKYPGSFFFKQKRIGQYGKVFYIWKLRTMISNADLALNTLLEQDEAARKEWNEYGCLRSDPRIAGKVGKFARQSSLDEIPQLINILKGEMGFIGPRPLEVFLYNALDNHVKQIRNNLLPGITGLWQVGPRSNSTIRQMQRYDKFYARNKSITLNAYILCKTLKTVWKKTGI